jgi:hypothetical protein
MVACDALDLLNCGFISVIDYSMLLLLIMHAEEPGVFFLSFQYSLSNENAWLNSYVRAGWHVGCSIRLRLCRT